MFKFKEIFLMLNFILTESVSLIKNLKIVSLADRYRFFASESGNSTVIG